MKSLFGCNEPTDSDSKNEAHKFRLEPLRKKEFVNLVEEQYDVLNDETFGSADKGDWEDIHENLVRLERNRTAEVMENNNDERRTICNMLFDNSEIDLLSKRTNDDTSDESDGSSLVAECISEFARKLPLDPSYRPVTQHRQPSQISSTQPTTLQPQQQRNSPLRSLSNPPPQMLSVQDIERRIIQNQHQNNQYQQTLFQMQNHNAQKYHPLQQGHQPLNSLCQPNAPSMAKPYHAATPMQPSPMMVPSPVAMLPPFCAAPPSLIAMNHYPPYPMRTRTSTPIPLLNHQPVCPPTGFGLPYNVLTARPYSTPINHQAMSPAFLPYSGGQHGMPLLSAPVAIGPPLMQQPVPPVAPAPIAASFLTRRSLTPLPHNPFNQRLVQEIQQNHPLLTLNRQPAHTSGAHGQYFTPYQVKPTFCPMPLQQSSAAYQQVLTHQQPSQNRIGAHSDKLDDEYADMMSNRDKQRLIATLLSQLDADIPYISDYYFTVFRQRTASVKAPDIMCNNRLIFSFPQTNGKGHYRCSFEWKPPPMATNGNEAKDSAGAGFSVRAYSLGKFEKSLGKLHCGSVATPRQYIEIAGFEGGSDRLPSRGCGSGAHPPMQRQRKALHVLLLIETLYTVVLKLEDLFNPVAMATAAYVRQKRQLLMECDGVSSITHAERVVMFDQLSATFIEALSQSKVTSMLCVRKGRNLLRRAVVVLRNHKDRWLLWVMIIKAFPSLQRKDYSNDEAAFEALVSEFMCHTAGSTVDDMIRLAKTIAGSDKVMQHISLNKFLFVCIINIIYHVEICCEENNILLQRLYKPNSWIKFLEEVNRSVKGRLMAYDVPNLTRTSTNMREDNIVATLRLHFGRFESVVNGTDLINFITNGYIPV